jgi:signal transduction histidine kinase/ligand-binding sensor domain-containing protein
MLWRMVLLLTLWAARAAALTPLETMTQLAHSSWGPKQGIASVSAIAQTQDGYLWIGTAEGLFKFDGVSFSRWQPNPEEKTSGPAVNALCAASDGSLWIGYSEGASRLRNGKLTAYTSADGLPRGEITSLLEDRQGTIWAGTAKGIGKWVAGHWNSVGRDSGLPPGKVHVELEDRAGTLWLAVDDPSVAGGTLLGALRRGQTQIELLPEHLGTVAQMREGSDLRIWVVESTGAIRPLSVQQGKAVLRSPGLALEAQDLLVDRDETVWICTVGRGLIRFPDPGAMLLQTNGTPRPQDNFTEKDGLTSDSVSCVFEDREGTIWVGSAGGLDRFHDNKLTSFSIREGLAFDQRLMVTADSGAAVWTGSEQGLQRVDGHQISTLGLDWIGPGLVSGVYSFHTEAPGWVWIAAQNGVGLLRNGSHSSLHLDGGLEMNNVTAMTRDKTDGLWLCDQFQGVCRVVNGKPRIFPYSPQLPASVVNAAMTDAQGRVWLGFQDGSVSVYDNGQFQRFNVLQSVMAMLCDMNGQVWAAGLGGLCRFAGDHFESLAIQNGLPSNQLSAIGEDNHGDFWLAGHSSIIRVSPAELDRAITDPSHLIRAEIYDATDGLRGFPRQGRPFPVMAKAGDGRLWFATTAGLTMIDPDRMRLNTNPPPVHIVQAIVDGKSVAAVPGMRFPAGTRDVKIDYAALSFVNPDKVRFRYYLEGHDKGWREAAVSRQVSYADLSPRSYKFRVTACNNDGLWAGTEATWDFAIRPAVYQTKWFFALAAGCCLLSFWGAYRWQMARVRAQAEAHMNTRLDAQMNERKRIAQELHDTLLQGFTGIRLKLWALSQQLPESQATAREQLTKVIAQADQCLAESRSSVWALRSPRLEEAQDLASALAQAAEQLVADKKLHLNFKVIGKPRELSGVVEFNLLRIGEEAVTNVVKHAQAHTIDIQIAFEERKVALRIKDDGRGFDPEHVPVAQREHQGLAGIRDRAAILGGTVVINSRPGEHTEIVVIVPA